MRTAEIMVCIALCGLASCQREPPASSADESSEGAEYVQEPVHEEMDPLHPVDAYPAGSPDLANPDHASPGLNTGLPGEETGGGIGGIGGMGGIGGLGGMGARGGTGGVGGMLR